MKLTIPKRNESALRSGEFAYDDQFTAPATDVVPTVARRRSRFTWAPRNRGSGRFWTWTTYPPSSRSIEGM